MGRSTAPFRYCTSALVASALALLACDGTSSSPAGDTAEGAAAEGNTVVSPSSKLDPRLGLDRSADQPREVVALLDERVMSGALVEEAAAGLDSAGVEALAVRMDAAKDRMFDRLASHK